MGPKNLVHFRNWFANHLGVDGDRKEQIYLELSESATLLDVTYWLQIIFAAGIATLGLVLNSPAVIIGAMLISPLMGPILAAGLSLATGDFVLGFRALVNLLLSCLLAVAVAALLVSLLPFKEITHEIVSRTQPTTLDLVVALLSGAIGSIATAKRVKGVVTSIPGVAIAVALMPPLGVVGYGIGAASSAAFNDGLSISRGGGLLFLTNLVAITFTAMVVFILLHLDTSEVKQKVGEWQSHDAESIRIRRAFARLPLTTQLSGIGKLPTRIFMILVPILILLLPLSQSFVRLSREIKRQQNENHIREVALQVWKRSFATSANGQARSYIDQLVVINEDGTIGLDLRVFTAKPYTIAERSEYSQLVAQELGMKTSSIKLDLIEIQTTSAEFAKAKEERAPEVPNVSQLQKNFASRISQSLDGLALPPPAQMVDYRIQTNSEQPLQVQITYLSERDIDPDGQALITKDVQTRLDYPGAAVKLERIPSTSGPLTFSRNNATLTTQMKAQLDAVATTLAQWPGLRLEISATAQKNERDGIADERANATREYLTTQDKVAENRISIATPGDTERTVTLSLSNQKIEPKAAG